MFKSVRTHIEKSEYTNIVPVFQFKSALELSKTDSHNLESINRLERDLELEDVAEYYSGKEIPRHFKSAEELIKDLDSE